MRNRAAVALSTALCLVGGTLAACFDLFHSTGNVLTACEIDAITPGCQPDAGIDLCAPTALEARQRASHACAWLGACETPLGLNAFGSCMVEALMAYDCAANPNHRFKGKAAALWGCLSAVRSCSDVNGCVFPAGPELCGSAGDYTSCGSAIGPAAGSDVVIECEDGGTAHGENCALWGKTCVLGPSGAVCAGGAFDAGCPVGASGCYGATTIHSCAEGGVDIGIDCSSFGAERCSGFPQDPQWVACVAETEAGPEAGCVPDASATCLGGVALSCPSGVVESLDCAALLGSPNACATGQLVPRFDWTSPCVLASPMCMGDSCNGTTLNGCSRGAAFSVDCMNEGLGVCEMVTTGNGDVQLAACSLLR
ncbi:MAG: hypothetical protein ACLP1X_14425 [Polyangiaceae bacterium]|jgi:hypothetical protein